jgi:hypothetical protein
MKMDTIMSMRGSKITPGVWAPRDHFRTNLASGNTQFQRERGEERQDVEPSDLPTFRVWTRWRSSRDSLRGSESPFDASSL